ncbi:glycosyltransferase [Sphingobacterium siyangense]|uniref:glycosyltransferase n=1 Tax=Sphingobacterium siyangense TaxID=459529 RepID=UPI003DA1EBEF
MENRKYALVYNFAQHYRKSIFEKMSENFQLDFYFGDKLDWAPDIKKMDTRLLKGMQKELKNKRFFKYFIWQNGAVTNIFKGKYDVIILYGDAFYISNWVILLYSRIFGKRTAIWTHGLYKDMTIGAKIFNFPFYWLANKVLLYGNYSKKKMINYGFDPKKLLVIYNSLDYENQLSIRSRLKNDNIYLNHFGNNKPVLIYIGRVQKIKKLEQAVSALEMLKGTDHEFNLVIVGEDKEGVNLKELSESKKLNDNIWFYGSSYDEREIGNLIFNADACISPGNIGLTVIHSLVYGTPALTHKNFQNQMPEFEAIEENRTGDFFEEDDINDIVRIIKKWINLDVNERNAIRINCFQKIDSYYNPFNQINTLRKI